MHSDSFFSGRIIHIQNTELFFSGNVHFLLVLCGKGQVTCREKTVYIHKGDFLFFPGHTLFSLTVLEELQLYEIRLLPHFFHTLCPDLETVSFHNFYITENVNEQRTRRIYQQLAAFVFTQDISRDISAGSLAKVTALSELFLTLCQYFAEYGEASEAPDNYVQERIRQIMDYIAANYTRRITVPEISHEMGLNAQYFGAFFGKHFHQSFVDFLNRYRIDNSMERLCHSRDGLTQIALDYGFQTYRSYSNAFRKIYHTSPSAYRSQQQIGGISQGDASQWDHSIPQGNGISQDRNGIPQDRSGISQGSGRNSDMAAGSADFSFLRKYLTASSLEFPANPAEEVQIQLDLDHASSIVRDKRFYAVSVGSGYQLLQEAVYNQLKKVNAECCFTHVHFRDPFCDLLSVYTEPAPSQPMFTWDYLDDIIRRILGLELHPFIEIGFMPRELAAAKDTLGYGYHPCIGTPKSIALWEKMIRSFLTHCIKHFGMEEMKNWRFDFWNSANIHSSEGFWSGTQKEFFDLYTATYRIFREIAPELQLGSPNFSLPGGISWYEDFLSMCREKSLHPDFLSLHLYSCSDNLQDFEGIFPYTPNSFNYLPLINTSYISRNLQSLKDLSQKYGFPDLPILAGEWNISYYLLDLVRDTAFMATYVVQTWIQTLQLLDGITYCNLSDISEHFRPSPVPFPGAQGLLSRDGIAKPAYNALFLLHKLDRTILYQDSHCLITRGKDLWHILLFHICDYEKNLEQDPSFLAEDYRYHVFKETNSLEFSGTFALSAGDYRITSYRIDREHGSAYDAWLRMGSPSPLTPEINQALLHASYPELHFEQTRVHQSLQIHVTLKPHTVILYEIRPV